MKFMGIDGCKAGWFFVGLNDDHWHVGVASQIAELVEAIQSSQLTLIDIPIGLPTHERRERLCDLAARKVLTKRKSSIFPVPCRAAIQCTTYKEGSRVNHQHTGRKLSIQSWGIVPKIKEVDSFLRHNQALYGQLREMHPEIGFWALNDDQEMGDSKKTQDGLQQRQAILSHYYASAQDIIDHALTTYSRKQVAKDDIVDALVLAVTATFFDRLQTFPTVPEKDESGLPMEIVYAKPPKRLT